MKKDDLVRIKGTHMVGIITDIRKKDPLVCVKHKPDRAASGDLVHERKELEVISKSTFNREIRWFEGIK